MSNYSEKFISDLGIAHLGLTMSPEQKTEILRAYEFLADAIRLGDVDHVISNNVFNYGVLLNKVLFLSIVQGSKAIDIIDYKNLNDMLSKSISEKGGRNTSAFKDLHSKLSKYCDCMEIITSDDITTALTTFGAEEATEDDVDSIPLDDLDDIDLDDNFEIIIVENIQVDFDEDTTVEDTDVSEGDESIFDIDDLDVPEDTTIEPDSNSEEANSEVDSDRKELEDRVEKLYESQINQTTKDIVSVLTALYESGFSSMPQAGILVNNGDDSSPLVRLSKSSNNMTSKLDGGTIYDYKIMKVLSDLLPQLSQYATTKDGEALPSIESMLNMNVVCHKLHMQFQSANIQFCTGKTSIRRWITETQLKDSGCTNADEWIQKVNKGKNTLTSFKKMIQPWYRWCIKKLIVESLVDSGVTSLSNEALASQVLEAINKNIRNVIVVAERDVGEKVDFKISTNSMLNPDEIMESISSALNIGASRSIEVKQNSIDAFNQYNVLSISVIFDKAAANKANLFAGDIVDKLIESGNAPSWSHALLGRKEDGTYFFWDDFMDPDKAQPEKRCYTIYAGSRSGKGVMTSTLVASALCDNKQIFYTDGKPENGVCLGDIAWSKGKEAYVFNGTPDGKDPYAGPMEQYTHGLRSNTEIAEYLDKLPSCLFEQTKYFTNQDQEKFLAVMRYLKSMTLCASIIEARASGKLPIDQWQIWVFDEMTAMSRQEKEIRNLFFKYLNDKGVKMNTSKDATVGMVFESFGKDKNLVDMVNPESDKYDAGIEYIYNWQEWNSSIVSKIANAAVISLGKADMNLIFIFQEPSWIATDATKTTVCKVVKSLKSTKIAGNKAIPRQAGEAAGEYGDATMRAPWIDKINSGNGWWVISNSSNIKSSEVTVFKPFTVWTKYLGNGPCPEDQKTRYLAGYVEKLLGSFGIDASDLLQSSYDYAMNAISEFGFASSLKEFMYDCSNFALGEQSSAYSNVIDKLSNGEAANRDSIYTSALGIEDESDDEVIDYGNENTTHGNNTDNMSDFERDLMNRHSQSNEIPQFSTTEALINKNLSDEALLGYLKKHMLVGRLQSNRFTYSDRNKGSNSGLQMACYIASNYHYICRVRQLDSVDVLINYLTNCINNGVEPVTSFIILVGILQAYDNSTLKYDVMPSQEMLQTIISEYQNNMVQGLGQPSTPVGETMTSETMFNIDNTMSDFEQSVFNNTFDDSALDATTTSREAQMYKGPYTDTPIVNPCYTENKGVFNIQPRPAQPVYRITPERNYAPDMGAFSFLERRKKTLFESKFGTSYEYKKRWEQLLNGAIQRFGSASMINNFAIMDGILQAKNLEISPDRFVDNELGITLYDLIDFHVLFKKLPFIQVLLLDDRAKEKLILTYGTTAQGIWKMFQEARNLRELIMYDSQGNRNVYHREQFAQTANKLNDDLKDSRQRLELQQGIDSMNPRIAEKGMTYAYNVSRNATDMAKHSLNVAKQSFMSEKPSVVKSAFYTALAVPIIGVGLASGLVGGVFNLFKQR